jgi:gas vesicle protein GvpK
MTSAGHRRVSADAEQLGEGLGRLVLAVLQLVRDLLERQAVRRAESGSLDDEQIERLGQALMRLEDRFAELREAFGCRQEDLELRLPFDAAQLLAQDGTDNPTNRR